MECLCNCGNDSILGSVKLALGIELADTFYDPVLIMHINTVFSILSQIGCGPKEGFRIDDDTTTWDEYTESNDNLNMVQSFMYMKVKLLFDPSGSSFLNASMEKLADELQFRINIESDDPEPTPTPVPID